MASARFRVDSNSDHFSGSISGGDCFEDLGVMTAISRAARLKIKRANSHIDTLVRESSVLSKDLYEITNGLARSLAPLAKPDGFNLAYRPKEPITDHFGPIIGDAINNLRESLDYWINAALAATGPRMKAHFPFSKEWKDLEASPNYPLIKKSFPDLADHILKHVKPCRDTNLHLWGAASLCNDNKHNDFVPTVSLVRVENINARVGTSTVQNFEVGGDANRPISIIRSPLPITIEQDFSVAVDITFPKGAIFENQPVIPTLLHMSQVVAQTLDALDRFIERAGLSQFRYLESKGFVKYIIAVCLRIHPRSVRAARASDCSLPFAA